MTNLSPTGIRLTLPQAWEDWERVLVLDGHGGLLACLSLKLVPLLRRGGDLEYECQSYESVEHFCAALGRLVECLSCTLRQARMSL